MTNDKNLKDLTIAIATHEYFKGSAQELKDYLLKINANRVIYVAHKFFYAKDSTSYRELYDHGELVSKKESPKIFPNEFLLYIRDAFYNLYYFLTVKGRIDLFVGSDSFNAIFGLILKKLGKVDQVVFFTIDYIMEDRFKFDILNTIYKKMDRMAFWGSDYTWNVSDRMSRQRVAELGEKAKEKKQLVAPIGIPLEARNISVERKNNILVYSGGLTPHFGLELTVQAMPALVKRFPDVKLRIIGEGEIGPKLKQMAEDLGVSANVEFVGYIDTAKERERWLTLLKESTLGLAPYEATEKTYKKFSDVTKPKDYMSCGLPVITTSVIPISEDIQQYNLGRVIEDSVPSYVEKVSELLLNANERIAIEKNVYAYSANMTWDAVYNKVFSEMDLQV